MDVFCIFDYRFLGFFDWFYEFYYIEVFDGDGGILRVHYVEVGLVDGLIVLLLYGELIWGYLYWKMMFVLVKVGI